MPRQISKIEFVAKKFKKGVKRTNGAEYWSVSASTPIRTFVQYLGKDIVQKLLLTEIDSRMLKADSKEKAKELFESFKNVQKDYGTFQIRKQLDQAIRNGDKTLAKKLFKSLV